MIGKRKRSVAGGRRIARRVVYGAADSLGMHKWSKGKEKNRVLTVSPDENWGRRTRRAVVGNYYRSYTGTCSEGMANLRDRFPNMLQNYITERENLRDCMPCNSL